MSKNSQYTEQELVQGCLQNDRRYQELLYKRYLDTMMGMCMRYTGDRDVALEILNAGFLRVFKKLHTFAFKGSLEGWIRRLVFHSLADYFKKQKRKVPTLMLEEYDRPHRENALDQLFYEDLIQMLNHLPPASKQVFEMYVIEGYNHKEISERVNISVGTSKWHLANARKLLQHILKHELNLSAYAG